MTRAVVIGAGIIGVCCALRLARAGAQTILVDTDQIEDAPRRAASLAAAGMLAPWSEALFHPPPTDAVMDFAVQGLQRWEQEARHFPDGMQLSHGALIIAEDQVHEDWLAAKLASGALENIAPQWLSADEARERAGCDLKIRSALLIAEEASVNPRVAYDLILRETLNAGCARVQGEAVGFGTVNGRLSSVICVDGTSLAADIAVVAPGAAASQSLRAVLPALAHVRPAKGQRIAMSGALGAGPTLRNQDVYIARGAADETIVGATMIDGADDFEIDHAATRALAESAASFCPALSQTAVSSVSVGLRAMSEDGAPLIGPHGPEGVFLATGHGRNGWLMAHVTADLIADYVFAHPVKNRAVFDPARFENVK
ncbi:MAG: FAD-dependent oxidoreductase [Caulobacterales bacterium]